MKKKIALFIRGFHNGGIEKVFELYYKHMDLKPFEIHVITHMKNDPIRKKLFEDLGCIIHEFSPICGHKINKKNIQEYTQLFNKYDFAILHNNMPEILLPTFFAKQKKVPVRIIHAHSVYTHDITGLKLKIYKIGFALNVSMATTLIGVSDEAAESVFLKKHNNAIILPNAIEIEKYQFNHKKREDLRSRLNLNKTIVLGHIGRYESDIKNQQLIFSVFEKLCETDKRYRLLLIGDGKFRAGYQDEAKQKGMDSKIFFAGNVDNVPDYLMAMDIFLFPSKQEGLGIAAIEAQAAGLPCIISDQVPYEVKVTEYVEFLKIYGVNVRSSWVKTIEKVTAELKNIEREACAMKVKNAGYDIESQVVNLTNIYLNNGK